jgi:hypothetical protein
MNDDLAAYLASVDLDLLRYLDGDCDLSLPAAEHLYRYASALLQGLILPRHVAEDWEDFFPLADAFVLAYGSKRVDLLNRRAALLSSNGARPPLRLRGDDRALLVELVRELGDFVFAHASEGSGGPAT